jgi:CHASE2 domain-containing sensor protein
MRSTVLGVCFLAFALSSHGASAGEVLIKPEEAALPPSTGTSKVPLITRAITRRPDLTLVSPEKAVTSPFNLQFKFQAHGGSTIKPDSFHLIYLKSPVVDLTQRVHPYVTANGVEMTGAEAPPGQHMIEAKVSDSDGRESSGVFVLNVTK